MVVVVVVAVVVVEKEDDEKVDASNDCERASEDELVDGVADVGRATRDGDGCDWCCGCRCEMVRGEEREEREVSFCIAEMLSPVPFREVLDVLG